VSDRLIVVREKIEGLLVEINAFQGRGSSFQGCNQQKGTNNDRW
jgi:hypothetical protein